MQFRKERYVEQCRLLMADGGWWSIPAMAAALGCSQTGASARIRDLRKERYGCHTIVKRLRPGGYFEYRMVTDDHIKQARRNTDEQ